MLGQKYNLFLIAFLFISCSDEKNLKYPSAPDNQFGSYFGELDYINLFRTSSNILAFKQDSELSSSATNHAIYNVENDSSGFAEESNKKFFTGSTPLLRAFKNGYKSKISEIIASNSIDFRSGVDTLLSNIYDRSILLSQNFNEIGIGYFQKDDKSSLVLDFGNSYIDEFCKKNRSDENATSYVNGICENPNIKISSNKFDELNRVDNKNVYFPNNLSTKAFFSTNRQNLFFGCKIMGNPVSIKFNSKNIKIKSFKIFDENNKEIKDTILMDHKNDPNKRLTKNEFVLLPLKVYKFNKSYRVKLSYLDGSSPKNLEWSFKTKTPEINYFVANDGESLALENDKFYDIFILPKNCQDVTRQFEYNYQGIKKFDIRSIDTNLLRVKLSGEKGANFKIITSDNSIINLILVDGEERGAKIFKYKEHLLIFLFSLSLLFGNIKLKKPLKK